jgi:hypothetical protein
MAEREENTEVVPLGGAKLSKRYANRAGFTIICGFITAIGIVPTLGDDHPLLAKALVLSAAVLGFYFWGKFQNKKI